MQRMQVYIRNQINGGWGNGGMGVSEMYLVLEFIASDIH